MCSTLSCGMSEDGYIIGNYLQATDQDIRDFFWTGSGDGPSSVLNPFERFPISEDAIIKTATVVATVYIDRNGGPNGYDDLCIFDCPSVPGGRGEDDTDRLPVDEDDYGHTVDNVTPTDRRFWLMTVIGGLYGRQDYPALEGKLAKLYRVAFARQQALHLGINGSTNNQQQHNNNTLEQQSMGESERPVHRSRRRVPTTDGYPRNGEEGLAAQQQKAGQKPELSSGGAHPHPGMPGVLLNGNVIAYEQRRKRRGRKALHKRDTADVVRLVQLEQTGSSSDVLPVPPVVEIIGGHNPQEQEGSGGGADGGGGGGSGSGSGT
uniref:Uncharacterized protein n=1 Tax=Anopheles maculatus TaxID=74869 RepID=A0A182S896_9DIPT